MGILDNIRAEQRALGLTEQDAVGFVRRPGTPHERQAPERPSAKDPNPFNVDERSAELLRAVAIDWGFDDVVAFIREYHLDGLVPAICPCGYSTEYEPDQRGGWCECCNAPTVVSALVLAGLA